MYVEKKHGLYNIAEGEKKPLVSVEDIKGRIEEIDTEIDEVYEREYRYGYMPDREYLAKLRDEKYTLQDVLDVLSEFALEDIQKELDTRDPVTEKLSSDGIGSYSFYVLAHAEKVLQHQDKELQARVDLGERVMEKWEEDWDKLSFEACQSIYGIIRDKSVPLDELEERIRKNLIRADDKLQELLVDIDGRRCLKVAEWKDGVDSYVLGNAVDSGEFYYAEVNGSICNGFEYDFRPSKEQVEDDWLNLESEREINRQLAWAQAWPGDRADNVRDDELYSGKAASAGAQEGVTMDYQKVLVDFGLDGGDESFRYQMLSRMEADCKYYLGNGGRHIKYLWAGNEKDQIACMKALWKSFPEDKKPEWLTFEQIQDFEKQMVGIEVLFTFGSWEKFPYQMGYVSITAPSVKMAIEEFRRNYPDVNEGTLNCSDYYYKEESVAEIKEHGNGAGCHRAIVVTSTDKSVDELIADGQDRVIDNGSGKDTKELDR